jgi:hypothetical protein
LPSIIMSAPAFCTLIAFWMKEQLPRSTSTALPTKNVALPAGGVRGEHASMGDEITVESVRSSEPSTGPKPAEQCE